MEGAATEWWILQLAASQNGVYITQQMCHISRLLSYDKDISHSKSNVFLLFLGSILIFLGRGEKTISTESVSRCKTHCYVAAPDGSLTGWTWLLDDNWN
jgi:hypothetical protein